MATYNQIFGEAATRIGSSFEEEEEKKKRQQQASQVAAKEQKTQSSYDRIFGEAAKRIEPLTPKKVEPSVVQEPAKVGIPAEEKKQPGLFEKITKKTGEILKGAKEAIWGKPIEKTAVGKPVEVQMSDSEWAQNVGRAVEVRMDMQRQLEEAKIDLDNFYRELNNSGKVSLSNQLIKGRDGHYLPISQPGVGYDPLHEYKEEHYNKVKKIQALQSGINEIDRFTGDAPARQGILKTVWGLFKNEGAETAIPFARGNYEKWLYSNEREAIEKYQKGDELTKEEQTFLNTFRARVYSNYADKGIPEQAGEVIADIPRYAVEIFATAGLVNPITSKIAGTITARAAPSVIKTIVPKILNNSVKMAAASNLNIPGISGKMAEYMLPTFDYEQGLGGKDVLDQLKPGDAPMEAGKKAYLTNLVEYISEGVGAYIDDALPFVKKAFVSKWLANRQVIDKGPGVITKALRTANFNSLVGEVLEEEIGEPFQAAIEKRDYKDPLFTPEGRERLLVETLGIGIFSGTASVSDKTIAKIVERRSRTGDKIELEPAPEKKEPETAKEEFEQKAGLQPQVPPGTEVTIPEEEKEEEPKVPEEGKTFFRGGGEGSMPKNLTAQDVINYETRELGNQIQIEEGVKPDEIKSDNLVWVTETPEQARQYGEVTKVPADNYRVIARDNFGGMLIEKLKVEKPPRQEKKAEEEPKVAGPKPTEPVREEKIKQTMAMGPKPKPIREDYFIRTYEGFQPIKGEPINIGAGIDAFVHKGLSGGYVVSEGRTGLAIGEASTKTAAIAKARNMVAENIERVNEVIERQIEDKGQSPRYIDENATINQDESNANQNLGGELRSGQPADTIPKSQDQPEGVGETVEEPVEEAEGISEGSDTGVGERPTTRIEDLDVPDEIQRQAEDDWTDNYAEKYGAIQDEISVLEEELKGISKAKKNALLRHNIEAQIREKTDRLVEIETAFVEKWRKKAIAYNEPVVESKVNQVDLNKEIEELVAQKGFEGYSPKELAKLKKYAGSGGLERVGAEGRGLLDEYYTPEPIVDFIWEKVNELQPDVKSVVEPSVGVGRFLKGVPDGAIIRGAEINKTSYTIAKVLYPKAFLVNKPFEDYFVDPRGNPKEFQANADLVIGNPPYGEHRGKYLGLGEEPKLIKYEDYFLKRGLNLLSDDGLLAYVIPSTFLRSGDYYTKQAISVLGYLEDAYRLPEGVFGTTSIGTDIVFIRKSPTTDETEVRRRIEDLSNNNWFLNNQDKVLGEVSLGTGRYGGDEVIGSLEDAMRRARAKPQEIEDTLGTEAKSENLKEEQTEIKQTEEAAKSEEAPPVNRVPEAPKITNELNKRAQIIPNKKDDLLAVSEISEEDIKFWSAVNVTGDLDSTYTAGFNPKTFYNTKIAIAIENGTPRYYPNIIYYQGNIYEKLTELELFKDEINERQYELQKRKLNEVLPEPQSLSSITLQPISDWVKQINLQTDDGSVNIITLFRDFIHGLPWEAFGRSSSWEIEGYLNGSIVNTGDKLQNIEIRKRRRDTGNSLFKRFIQEVLTQEQKDQLEREYNRNFNAYYRPDYSQVPLLAKINATFNPKGKPGKHPFKLYPHQREGAAFLATKGAGLLAYDVGMGKTSTSILAINEVLKRGWAKRPLIVVPNGVYRNWINEISEIIPNVKINSLMNLGGAFKGDLSTLEIEEGTLSIITYDGLVKLGFKDETYDELTKDLRDVMTGMNTTKRAAEKELQQVEQQIGRAIKGTTNQRFFEDLGFDHITIDEVHNFKNIFAGAKVERGHGNEYRNVRGSSSARGIKAYLMAQYILKNNGGRNVFLLSATPFTNSPMEIYSILSLMGKTKLEELGLKNVNDFMSMFMELKPTFVVKANQSVAEEDVIEKFQNLQQLQKLVTEFIDFRTGEEAGIDRPGKIKRTITLSPTETQNEYIRRAQPLFNDKEKGGAIVAITELQNITLSPYLSRFNIETPSYIDFVENSPKIKYAVEAVAQTYKDNKDVGQIIYMPRGIEYFPLLQEYLIKEKGFAKSQIGVITGGMNIDVKQKIQNAFNAGTIKVLIGTEAIKEGVNLQEKSTDLYHLHLPWNPTDILQIEGRIWRQGNDWSNVRIHYPLIENSVDSFIFQKLETKEKRIKNLWSYKDNEIELGDLNFEEMKLDLITNPVIRVNAEKTFETKKERQKLETLKVEKAFVERRVVKVKEAEEELKRAEEYLEDAIRSGRDADYVNYFKKNRTKARTALTNAKRDLVAGGIDVADLEKKANNLQKQIDEQEKVIDLLDKKYKKLLAIAEKQKEVLVSKPNNYAEHIAPIVEDNKTFFVKRKPDQRVRSSDYKGSPGGTATLGGFADIESASKTVDNLRAVEFPELLRLAQDLSGNTPTLKKFRRALGRFYDKEGGIIKLHPDIFKDPQLSVKVFAHELGHLTDYLPDKTLIRGNILGRIASLKKFLKGTFGEKEINNAEIRAELKDLSQAWKPFDELENPNFTSYRYSSKELYADAISVLFNDPALLKEKAPQFYQAFFDNLDSKPEFKNNFFELQDLLAEGTDSVFKARDEALSRSYERGENAWAAKIVEARKRASDLGYMIETLFSERNAALNRRVKKAIKRGETIDSKVNPALQFAGLRYLDGKLKNFVYDNFQPVYTKAQEVSDGWNLLGKILQLERAIYERGELANPGGYDPKTAQDQLNWYERNTAPADWVKIQEAKELFRNGVKAVVKLAEENKYYTPELLEQIKANPAYATFQVIDYLDTHISSRIHQQIGTLKDIANPATSTVMKAIATMKAIEYNNAKVSAIDFQRERFKDEITPARTRFNGKFMEIIDPADRSQDLVVIIRDGKPEGWYLPKEVARILNGTSSDVLAMAAKVSRIISGARFYKPLFTTLNLGFQTFNFVRDFNRYWKNVPDRTFREAITSLPRAMWRYAQAVPASMARARNIPNELIREMENAKILGLTFNDIFASQDPEDQQIERVLQKAGILQKTKKSFLKKSLTPIVSILQGVEVLGNFIETLPKVAGYIELKGRMPKEELAEFIRTNVGSPSFRTGGEATQITNSLFLFSNAYIQGVKSDLSVATDPKTAAGFWWKTIVATILPKMIMFGLAYGLGGDWLKERFRDVSEYNKTNYTIIPLGVDENGKTVYMRIPQDETGRFIGGILWKMLNLAESPQDTKVEELFQVFDFGAGQLPNIAPSLVGLGALKAYLSGRNPYDSFRGRHIIPDTEFQAGFEESFPIFMDWFFKQQGLGILLPSFTPDGVLTDLQKVLHAPFLSNIAGRWVAVSDYGRTEELQKISRQVDKETAKKRLETRRKVDEAVKEFYSGPLTEERRVQISKKLVEEIVGVGPYEGDRKAEFTRTVNRFKVGIARGKEDPNADALIYAGTNNEKLLLLQEIRKDMEDQEFRDFVNEMHDLKVIGDEVIKELKKMDEVSMSVNGVPAVSAINAINDILESIIPVAYAAEEVYPTRINADQETGSYTIYYSNGSQRYTNIDFDLGFWDQLEGMIDSVATKIGLPNLLKGTSYDTKQERLNAKIQEVESEIAQRGLRRGITILTQAASPTPTIKSEKTSREAVEVDASTKADEATKTPYNGIIKEVFGDDWVEATRVLRYQDESGEIHGENVDLQASDIDRSNEGFDTPLSKKVAPGETLGGDGLWHSQDRGLFRINSRNFATEIFGDETQPEFERLKGRMKEAGIDVSSAQAAWDDMNDPEKNIRMAKIIYDEGGWSRWYAAPPDLFE